MLAGRRLFVSRPARELVWHESRRHDAQQVLVRAGCNGGTKEPVGSWTPMPREGEGSRGDPWCPLKSLGWVQGSGPRGRDPGRDMRGTCTHARTWDGQEGGRSKPVSLASSPASSPARQPGVWIDRRLSRDKSDNLSAGTLVSTRTEGETRSGQRVPVRSADTCVWSLRVS